MVDEGPKINAIRRKMKASLAAFLALLVASALTEEVEDEQSMDYRLPRNVVPSNYLLIMRPDFDKGKATGYVEIDVNVRQVTDNITFHAKNIDFQWTEVHQRWEKLKITAQTVNKAKDFKILHFARKLNPGPYTIKINFTSSLGGTAGFFMTSYLDKGKKRFLAASNFEPTHAREAFPCFDEPALKACFDVRLRRRSDYKSLANMPMKNMTTYDKYEEDVYWTSEPMSTYALAFAVTDFRGISRERISIHGQPWAIGKGDGSAPLEFGIRLLKHMENYLGMRFALPKLDHIELPRLPNDAMEGWGLVTYGNGRLLYNQHRDSVVQKQSVFKLMAHAVAHQWFGNLATPAWWNHVWLSEGLSALYGLMVAGGARPDWRLRDQFVVDTLHETLKVDYKATTRPMNQDIARPDRIRKHFDVIVYGKSACVLFMLQNAITEGVFHNGVKGYLKSRQYNIATSADLWRNIQKAVDEAKLTLPSISTMMLPWENQKGYPMVIVTRDYGSGSVKLTQKHYNEKSSKSSWHIPFNYATSKNPDFSDTKATGWLASDKPATFKVPSSEWVIVNKQQTGFYRVNYDKKNWKLLADYLNTKDYEKIHPNNRAQLIDDAFDFASNDVLGFDVALDLTKYVNRETDFVPLGAFFGVLDEIEVLASGAANYPLFQKHIGKSLDKAFNLVGVAESTHPDEEKEHLNNLNRANVIKYACRYQNQNCLAKASIAIRAVDDVSSMLRRDVFCAGLRGASPNVWEKIYKRSFLERDRKLKNALVNALGCSQDPKILAKYLQREKPSHELFRRIYTKGYSGVKFVLDYTAKNYETLYKGNAAALRSLLKGVVKYLARKEHLKTMKTLAQNNKHADMNDVLKAGVLAVQANLKSYGPRIKALDEWIAKNLGKGRTSPE